MKKHHILLIVLFVGIAAYFLNEARNLQGDESIANEELNMLREAVKKSPGAGTASTLAGKSSRLPAIDSTKFIADLADILKSSSGDDRQNAMQELEEKYGAQLTSTPVSKLKEMCDMLEEKFPLGQADSEMAGEIWTAMLGWVAKSDPAWAFAKFEKAASMAKAPIDSALGTFRKWAYLQGEPMSLAYAGALQKWLDGAQAAGKIQEGNSLLAELRTGIAVAQGESSAAMKQISQLPYLTQREAAIDYVEGLLTPDARRQAMEELSTALHIQNFSHFVRELADQQGFDAAREILSSASLTPEKYDLAAASIAAANAGPDTPAKAKWLLESLRSDDKRAILEFTDQWTHADYQGGAQWLSSLPAGKQRDVAISGFAPIAAKIDGASAVDWALTLTDPNERRSCVDEVVRKWKETDAEAATAYLKEKGVTVR